jgi:hypothetical protein
MIIPKIIVFTLYSCIDSRGSHRFGGLILYPPFPGGRGLGGGGYGSAWRLLIPHGPVGLGAVSSSGFSVNAGRR